MLDDALAMLEWVTRRADEPMQTADVWEALRTVAAAGGDRQTLADFWKFSGYSRCGPDHQIAYANLTACMNGLCRSLGIERSYRMIELRADD